MNVKRFRILLALVITFLTVAGALALVWALSGDPQAAHAQGMIRYVAPGGECGTASPCYSTVQEAVDVAQEGDEIRVAAGTYTGINNYGGLAQVIYITKSLTIQGGYTTDNWGTPDPEANRTELNAMALGRVMVISGTADVAVEGLHLTYGNAADLGNGGGIYVLEANVTLKHTWVLSNSTPSGSSGGGLYLRNASAILDDDTFHGNYAGYGGAFCLYQSDLTMNDSVVQNNKTYYRGGGLYVNEHSNATLRDNVIQDNSSGVGGGARLYKYSSATFISNLIEGNSATVFDGGGVQIQWDCSATFISNTIRGNSASAGGGGVMVWQSDATFSGNTIEDNTTGGSGGGILSYVSGNVLLANNVIQGNKAYGGAVVTCSWPTTSYRATRLTAAVV
jgi:parallel beta-helix repeat protein